MPKIMYKEYIAMMTELANYSNSFGVNMASDLLEEFALRGELDIVMEEEVAN